MARKFSLSSHFIPAIVVVLMTLTAAAQTQPDWTGANVVLRDRPGAPADGDFDLITVKDGQVLHMVEIGRVAFYGKSRDRFVALVHEGQQTRVLVFELPSGNQLASYLIPNLFAPVLMEGAADISVVDQDAVYYGCYESATMDGVFVKTKLSNGETTILRIPPRRTGGGKVGRAGDYILAPSQFAYEAYSIRDAAFAKSVPKLNDRRYTLGGSSVYIPHDGLYAWNILGEFTRLADESLDPVLDEQRQTQTIVRGVFAVLPLDAPVTDQVLVILSGPSRNGALRGEAIESALTFAKPSRRSILATVKLPFTPTTEIFRTSDENVIAIINSVDGTIMKYDCVSHKEIGPVKLPPVENRVRIAGIKLIY